ncbi:nucleolar complex protein 2 homolog [Diachasma alloeum]|uniref:nucleolar complex protein 2 homolog n=1 Tax=Diachasma alloeum TaxID=454923 RepID=UPI000738197B|nr:nucleolar complex protein 2 homolog [Diachasma alloeum]
MKLKKTRKTKVEKRKKMKKDLSEITTDEFFNQDFEASATDSDLETGKPADSDSECELDPKAHKKSLQKLQDTDPEFYEFLKQNDKKLLNFDLSDQEDCEDENENADEEVHVPSENLQVASDEDDDNDDDNEAMENKSPKGMTKVTLKLLKVWQEEIQKDKTTKTIKSITEAFHAALLTVADPEGAKNIRYKVEGSAVFNGVVQLCIIHLPTAFRKLLKISSKSKFEAHKSKRFAKIKGTLKSYLSDLLRILQNVTSPDILTVLLKHLHQMIPYTQSFSSLNKPLMKILLKLWSSGEETVRVVAFLNILQIAMNRTDSTRETLMKTMYIKYVENSKFVSESTSACINFMRHSLAEIYLLDHNLAYTHAFLYVRQLAIHLRNAVTLKKKENFQTVYNWQYINSLRFWTELVNLSNSKSMLRSLLYPLVQIIIGTITLIPTAQFYPLRFHCCQMLINISKETEKFIPVLPYLLEVLTCYDFNKKHKSVTMKPLSFICLLRMSKGQLQENGFKNSLIDNIYQLILECAAKDSHTICFPDMYVFCIIQLKLFLKKCKVANFCKKMKQLMDKIQENRQFIETERNKIIVDLSDMPTIRNWENTIKNKGTPLSKFYQSWYNLHHSQKLKMLTQNDAEGDLRLPILKRSNKRKQGDDFDHDSDLDMPVEEMNKLLKKQEEKKRQKKKQRQKMTREEDEEDLPTNDSDVVKDTNLDDWN